MLQGNKSLVEFLWGKVQRGQVDPTIQRNGLQRVYVVVAALVTPAECLMFHAQFSLAICQEIW